MSKQFFKNHRSDGLSKIDYWKKWELFTLFDDLHKAEQILVDIAIDKNKNSLLKFKMDFIKELYEIESDNVADFTRIWDWFAPSKEWDTLVGESAKELGCDIFRITDKWKRSQDFLKGTKVSLENEFGVVLDKIEEWDAYGLIRWDTNKETDTEDWRGLFGSFLQAGGQVVNTDHKFNFINDDGTVRNASS
jgi:hypothetical protein